MKVLKVLMRVDIYSGVNNFWFKQWVSTYCADVTHGLRLNTSKVIWIKILVYYKNYIDFVIFNVRQEFYVSMNLKNYNKDRDVKKASFSVYNLYCFQQMQHET